jgi:hypothetical protein
MLRLADVGVPSAAGSVDEDLEYVCEPLVACLTHIIQNLTTSGASLPAMLRVSKLTPVPKSSQAAARLDKDNYRAALECSQHFQQGC